MSVPPTTWPFCAGAPCGTRAETFAALDGDKSGFVTQDEFEAAKLGGMLMELDGDGDGRVNLTEFQHDFAMMPVAGLALTYGDLS